MDFWKHIQNDILREEAKELSTAVILGRATALQAFRLSNIVEQCGMVGAAKNFYYTMKVARYFGTAEVYQSTWLEWKKILKRYQPYHTHVQPLSGQWTPYSNMGAIYWEEEYNMLLYHPPRYMHELISCLPDCPMHLMPDSPDSPDESDDEEGV